MSKKSKQLIAAPDLSHLNAATLMIGDTSRVRLILVGCGGTGSWLAPSVARFARVLQDEGKDVQVLFWDHDHVEPKNIPRQNFCQAELGLNKAVTLAARYSTAWGIEIAAHSERFKGCTTYYNGLEILIGCVDNAAARKAMHNNVDAENRTWWLDCGNTESAGQVLLGNTADKADLKKAFLSPKTCQFLPSPGLQAPDLLVVQPAPKTSRQSCAEIQLANTQSLAVNQMVASIATDYLLRMLTGGLRKYATYFDLVSGSMRSNYILPEVICR